MIAGPSEIVVVADGDQDPEWIAADLLSQAEHDELAQAVLITDDAALADAVAAAVERQLADAAAPGDRRRQLARPGRDHRGRGPDGRARPGRPPGARSTSSCSWPSPPPLAARISNAGAIFLGAHTPEVIGDYVGGPEPRPADRSQRPLRLGPVGLRLPEADHAARLPGRRLRRARAGRGGARARRRSRRPRRGRVAAPAPPPRDERARAGADHRHPPGCREHRPLEPRGRARAPGRGVRPPGSATRSSW